MSKPEPIDYELRRLELENWFKTHFNSPLESLMRNEYKKICEIINTKKTQHENY